MSSKAIKRRINEIAVKYCNDYPDIEKANPLEQLYAIEATLQGIDKANQDCHKIIKYFLNKCGMTPEQLVDIWRDITKEEVKTESPKIEPQKFQMVKTKIDTDYKGFYSHYEGNSIGRVIHYVYIICGLRYAEQVRIGDGIVKYGDDIMASVDWSGGFPYLQFKSVGRVNYYNLFQNKQDELLEINKGCLIDHSLMINGVECFMCGQKVISDNK